MPSSPKRKSSKKLLLYIFLFFLCLGLCLFLIRKQPHSSPTSTVRPVTHSVASETDATVFASYGLSETCQSCHQSEYQLWRTSHHALAERGMDPFLDGSAFTSQPKIVHASQTSEVSTNGGHFQLITAALDGQVKTFTPERVIGVEPLRQFLIPASGGRFQAAELAFDPIHTNWFDVYGDEDRRPGEWGHWTGRGMTWNSMCASCHNTRLRKHYIETNDTYATSMAEMSVACEACHGPLVAHNEWQKANAQKSSAGPDPTLKHFTRDQILHTCASCHSRRAELTGEFVPGDDFFDHYVLSIPDESDVFYPDGQIRDEDYEFTAFSGSRMHAGGVRCIDCHEPHSAKVLIQGNGLCMSCHATGKPLLQIRGAQIALAPIIDPITHTHHKAGQPGDRCVDCHMPITNYMQRHGRHDHGFTIPDPLLTKEAAIPNACARCHAERGAAWTLAAVEKWYGKRMERPSRARALALARAKAGDIKAQGELLDYLRTETNSFWRAVATSFLRRWAGDTNVTRALVTASTDPDPLVRSFSIRSLEPLASTTLDQNLISHLNDPIRSVRIDTAWALRQSLDTNSIAGLDLLNYLRYSGDQPSGAMQTGIFQMDRGNIPGALECLKKAVAWDTNSAPPRHALAVALSLDGKAAEAVEQLQIACRLAPRDAEMQFKLGLALNEIGNANAARAALEQAVKLDPQFAQAWYNLGLAYNLAQQPDTALDALLRAESLDLGAPQIPYARAAILANLGRHDEARKAARRALELRPDYADAVNLLNSLDR